MTLAWESFLTLVPSQFPLMESKLPYSFGLVFCNYDVILLIYVSVCIFYINRFYNLSLYNFSIPKPYWLFSQDKIYIHNCLQLGLLHENPSTNIESFLSLWNLFLEVLNKVNAFFSLLEKFIYLNILFHTPPCIV